MDGPAFQVFQCADPDCRLRFPAAVSLEGVVELCPRCGRPLEEAVSTHSSRGLTYPVGDLAGPPAVALLDNIRSLYNVGAMFRTADGAGLNHLYLCGITATPEQPRLAKTALGAENVVPWSYHPNGLDLARELCEQGYQLWAMESGPEAVPFFAQPIQIPEQPLVLVVGNELAGIDPAILAVCHRIMALPMSGRKNSLNVEVAFGIAAYAIRFTARPESTAGNAILFT